MSKPRKNGTAAPEAMVRPMRISYTDVPPRTLGALELAFGRLEGNQDPRLMPLTPADVQGVAVQVLDPPPQAALITLPGTLHSTLAVHFSADGIKHHALWHPVAQYFQDRPGQLPRDPVMCRQPLGPCALAAIAVEFEGVTPEAAAERYRAPQPEPQQVVDTDVQLVGIEAALVKPNPASGSRVLYIADKGIWWPVLRIMKPATRAPDPPSWSQTHNYPKLSIT